MNILFTHYGREARTNQFTSLVNSPTAEDLDEIFADYTADIIFFGHDHQPNDLAGKARYINPGALGCNAEEAVARYLVLEIKENEYQINRVEVPYETADLFREFEARQVPARDFICETFYSQLDKGEKYEV